MRRRSPLTGTPRTSLLQTWMQGASPIVSVQRGTVTITTGNTTATATITTVVTANARIKWIGCNDLGADSVEKTMTRVALTNATTVTATVAVAPTNNLVTGFEVVEYATGVLKSVTRGTIAIAGGTTSNTATITAVNTAKAEVTFLGATFTNDTHDYPWLTLTNATTVTATNNGVTAFGTATVGYEVAEYF